MDNNRNGFLHYFLDVSIISRHLCGGQAVLIEHYFSPLSSSMFAPGIMQVLRDFDSGSALLSSFVVSVYILGFAFGPLVIAPLSEYSGRSIGL
jgi:hypothetical protein